MRYDDAMTVEFFERDYGHLLDSDDAQKVFGPTFFAGVTTVGDIRNEIREKGYPKDASIRADNDGRSYFITTLKTKFFVANP
jgi:hypothetical protein